MESNSSEHEGMPGKQQEHIWKETIHTPNLYLQMLFFFNVYLSVIWVLCYGYYIICNISTFERIHTILVVFGFLVSIPTEISRLFIGYSGNLKGKIADLAGFWILSTLIQLPIYIYFIYNYDFMGIVFWVQYLLICCLFLEIFVGAFALRKLSTHQNQQYHIKLISSRAST